jgi:CRP-like cAMP-binding protein
MIPETIVAGEQLYKVGDSSDKFYVVDKGAILVLHTDEQVNNKADSV